MKNFWLDRFPTFMELMQKQEKSKLELLLLQCVATLSTHPIYAKMTPEQVYDTMVGYTKSIHF